MSYDDPKPASSTQTGQKAGVPVYKRILDLFEAEGIKTLFGIPDPNFVHVQLEGEEGEYSDPAVQEEKLNRAADAAAAANKTKLLIKAQKGVRLREIQRIVGAAMRDEMTLHVAVMETPTGETHE